MDKISLPNTRRSTTRLGFGCSTLMGRMNRRESLAVLDAAWDAGIRHFDVAPVYGWGAAEGCVGEFLSHRGGEGTVTTKYGILPPMQKSWIGLCRSLARPVIRAVPSIKQRLIRTASVALGGSHKARISAPDLRASLERSRNALQRDCIDMWLFHDVDADQLKDRALLDTMHEAVSSGIIGEFGVSQDVAEIPGLYAGKHEYCHILQFEWSVRQQTYRYPRSFPIHHRTLAHNFVLVRDLLLQHDELRRAWSDELDCDLGSSSVLAGLMLKAALVLNPDSIILVSSKEPAHISANVRTAEDAGLEATARRFYELLQLNLPLFNQDPVPATR